MAKAIKAFNKLLRDEFGNEKVEAVEEDLVDWCREIAENKDLVTILSVKYSHSANVSLNIEENILNALLKCEFLNDITLYYLYLYMYMPYTLGP